MSIITSFRLRAFAAAFLATASVFSALAPGAMAGVQDVRAAATLAPQRPVIAVVSDDVAAGARDFIDSMGERAISFLSDPSLGQEQRKTQFRKLLRDSYDMDTIARFALGRYWRLASAGQRKDYLKLFETMVVNVYARRFEDYKGQKFEVRGQRPDGDSDILVTSYIVPDDGSKVKVDWRVRYKGGKYRIVDVIVEGVSMAMTQRSDFSAVIQNGGGDVQVLIDHLKAQQ